MRYRLSLFIVVFATMLISAQLLRAEDDYPENTIPVMKHWMNKQEIELTKSEFKRLLDFFPVEEAEKLYEMAKAQAEYGSSEEERRRGWEMHDIMLEILGVQGSRKCSIEQILGMEKLYQAYEHLTHEEFALALSALNEISATPIFNFLHYDEEDVGQAYSKDYLLRWDWETLSAMVSDQPYRSPPRTRGYEGIPTKDKLLDWVRDRPYILHFIMGMIKAEACFRLSDYETAAGIYENMLLPSDEYKGLLSRGSYKSLLSYSEYQRLLSYEESRSDVPADKLKYKLKMIKIRLAFVYLEWGDRLFKRAHGLTGQEKEDTLDSAKGKYEKALALFPDSEIARRIDDRIKSLNALDEQLLRDINKPDLVVEIPENLLEPLAIPMKTSLFSKPFTITRQVSLVKVQTEQAAKTQVRTKEANPLISSFKRLEKAEEKKPPPKSEKFRISPPRYEAVTPEKKPPASRPLILKYELESKIETVQIIPDLKLPLVTQENPLIIQIVCHAKMQLLKINKGLNYLGYTDGYVPDQRYATLYAHADEYADLAIQAENRYIQFKKEAEEQEYQTMQLEQNIQIAVVQEQIARTRQAIAKDRMKQADLRMKAIDEKIKGIIEAKKSGFFKSWIKGIFSGFVSLVMQNYAGAFAGFAQAGEAFIGAATYSANSDHEVLALRYEKRAVAVDKAIAAKEGFIAELETTIAQMQQLFMKENINYLALREMNQELFYELAKTLRQIKEKYLEVAIRTGFLAERALAFEMGREMRLVKFDYEVSTLKGLLAGDLLKQDLKMMEYSRLISLKQRNHVKYVISLRERYPIEFTNFIQTGEMTFVTGLYDFDKAYPGTYQRRLKRVEVVIQGVIGPEGFKGSLTNFGSFVVREKEDTFRANRLIPTEDQLRNAYEGLSAHGLSVIPVGGVRAFNLPPTRLILSRYDIRRDQIVFPPETEVREPFEGFGVAGIWRLELPKSVNDADYRTIADVKLILYFDTLYDPDLERKVIGYRTPDGKWIDGLVQRYEKEVSGGRDLDRIAFFSLRQHFPDEFFGLTGGKVEFELLDGDFPLYMTGKKVKKIMLMVIDRNGKGIEGIRLRIAKLRDQPLASIPTDEGGGGGISPPTVTAMLPDQFSAETITDEEGYAIDDRNYMNPTSDTVLPERSRFPVVGRWRIELTDPGQAMMIDDLLLFIMYEYKEKR